VSRDPGSPRSDWFFDNCSGVESSTGNLDSTERTGASTETTGPSIAGTDPSIVATDSSAKGIESSTGGTDSSTEQTESPTAGTESPTQQTESPTEKSLFAEDELSGLRSRWDEVQSGFVDDPTECVQKADGLVSDVVDRLTTGFSEARSRLEAQWARGEEPLRRTFASR
jgi:hypothetical protein